MKKINTWLLLFLLGLFSFSCATTPTKKIDDQGRSTYTDDKKQIAAKTSIQGIVYDSSTRKPILGAIVEIKNANRGVGYYKKITDSSGFYKVDDFIPNISYTVEVSAVGYVSRKSNQQVRAGSCDFWLDPAATISGVIKDTRGNPIQGVEVKLKNYSYHYYGSSQNNKPKIVETDHTGSYFFSRLDSGSYMLTFSKVGYITETAQLQHIKTGESFKLPMALTKPSSIRGKITIEGLNAPAVNIYVRTSGKLSLGTSTYQDGSYQLEDLKPGFYQLHITHQGFHTIESGLIQIQENDHKKNINFIVRPQQPKLNVYSYRYTYVPGNKIGFNLQTFRLETVTASVYQVPINMFLRGRINPEEINPKTEGFKLVTSWKEGIKDFRPYDWRYQTLEIAKPLPTGGYCVEVKGDGNIISRKFFTITSVGIVLKRTQQSVFAYASNLVDNKPIENARVVIFDATPDKTKRYYTPPNRVEDLPLNIFLKGTTGEDGVFHEKLATNKMLSALVIGVDGSYAICNSGSPQVFQQEQQKYFIYTDRPVYRAGDEVFFKIVAKKRLKRFVPVAGSEYFYKITDALGKTIKKGNARLDQWGTASGTVKLLKDTRLGQYNIYAGPTQINLYGNGYFHVEQYRKPEFKIDLTPLNGYYVNGDMVEFKIEAKYFFGAPLKDALVKFRFYENRLSDSDGTYWWEDGYGSHGSYNRLRLDSEKYVDKNGIAVVSLHSGNFPFDRTITLEATIVDNSNVSITSRATVRVGRGEYYIKVNPSQQFYSDNEKKHIEIQTLTHTGTPLAKTLRVKLYRYTWKPLQRVYVHDKQPLFSEKVTTDDKGTAIVKLPKKFPYYGEFDIVVTGTDRRDNVITASRIIWIYSWQGGQVASKFKNLELVLNKKTLQKEGTVTCLVKSRFIDSSVCLTLEGRDIYQSKVVKMTGNVVPVTFNIKDEYAPNLYVSACMQRKRALYTTYADLEIASKGTLLNIQVQTDKKQYLPGAQAKITLKVTDEKGNPVNADLSLAAVDESIFYIRPDHTQRMKDFFYTKISNWVLTSYSFPITLLAGVGKDSSQVKIRQKFKDTAFWKGNIRTGKDGLATMTIDLPDNLTTWRLTTRGHDKKGRVGESKKTFLVTQELIARIGKPRFMLEGDEISLLGIVNSNTTRGLQDIQTRFMINGTTLTPDAKLKISLPAFGSARNYYTYRVPENLKKLMIQYNALADKYAKDALLVNMPVERKGVAYKLYGSGDMGKNSEVTIKSLAGDSDFTFVPESISININPSPIIQMLKAAEYLNQYPYGCLEQTMNKFIPLLALQRLINQKGYGALLPEKAKKDIGKKVVYGLRKIENMQLGDGSWGWFAGGRGNTFITGYVMYSLHLAKKSGYEVDGNVVKNGLAAIEQMLSHNRSLSADEDAYLLFIYSLWGKDHDSYLTFKPENNYQRAYHIRALANYLNRKKLSATTIQKYTSVMSGTVTALKQTIGYDNFGIIWNNEYGQQWNWPGGNVEITAHVLSALVEANDSSPVPAKIMRSLGMRNRDNHWTSTKETAAVILAMCAYNETKEGSAKIKGSVNFAFNNKQATTIAYDLTEMDGALLPDYRRTIELKDNASQKEFTIKASGNTSPELSYDVTVNGILYFKPKGIFSFLKSKESGIKGLSNGIKITRYFGAISRVRDMHNNEYLVPQSLEDAKKIQVGDELLVKLRFKAQDNFTYLMLEDYLPSGFEVIMQDAYKSGNNPYVHVERWDNRMLYFFANLEKGQIYEVAYIIRAELPGKFMVKPTRMECMYEPSIQGWSMPTLIEVKKK